MSADTKLDATARALEVIEIAVVVETLQGRINELERHRTRLQEANSEYAIRCQKAEGEVVRLRDEVQRLKAPRHVSECGTRYRGCAPDCPKDLSERLELARDRITELEAREAELVRHITGA